MGVPVMPEIWVGKLQPKTISLALMQMMPGIQINYRCNSAVCNLIQKFPSADIPALIRQPGLSGFRLMLQNKLLVSPCSAINF